MGLNTADEPAKPSNPIAPSVIANAAGLYVCKLHKNEAEEPTKPSSSIAPSTMANDAAKTDACLPETLQRTLVVRKVHWYTLGMAFAFVTMYSVRTCLN